MTARSVASWPVHFLNRLNMEEVAHQGVIHPLSVIHEISTYASTEELFDLFAHFCESARAELYSWKEGSPGNCLFFAEQLELLIEACYLIYTHHPGCPRVADLRGFFVYKGLSEWKHLLHCWLEAALSDSSIHDEYSLFEQDRFAYHINRLIATSHMIPSMPVDPLPDGHS
ncbi:MAG: hypothetical protein QM781_17580 [Chitinophagaceae bacterium]